MVRKIVVTYLHVLGLKVINVRNDHKRRWIELMVISDIFAIKVNYFYIDRQPLYVISLIETRLMTRYYNEVKYN